jgi:hypothetical protein
MTTLTLPAGRPSGSFFHTVFDFCGALLAGARDGNAMARRYERLSHLSDAQLADLGLRRDDVPQFVAKTIG